ncbi:hypothetical protein [Brevundimonas sp.]|uniref:hypothetical protein n=1 Tax=Brevundimonas sp. TaxID=1871086 RepID=UPI00344DA142
MGHIVGDSGLFYQNLDIAVVPAHQCQGLGKAVIAALLDHLPYRAMGSLRWPWIDSTVRLFASGRFGATAQRQRPLFLRRREHA